MQSWSDNTVTQAESAVDMPVELPEAIIALSQFIALC
jgi:hypothetical protein